jgi:hypothetical protein
MVAYEKDRNAYRIWKPNTNSIIFGQDVMQATAAAKGETTSEALMTMPIRFLRAAEIANLPDYKRMAYHHGTGAQIAHAAPSLVELPARTPRYLGHAGCWL